MRYPIHNPFRLFLLVLLIPLYWSCSQKAIPAGTLLYRVSGKITQSHAYCGGARPPQALLDEMTKPTPFPGKKLFIRSGSENSSAKPVLKEIVSDSLGLFSILLPPGNYCVVQEDQVNKLDIAAFRKKLTSYDKLDETCLQQWWDKCFLTFEVGSADKTNLNIHFHFPCFTNGLPCITYTGPLPQ